jgi:hypothetical protein
LQGRRARPTAATRRSRGSTHLRPCGLHTSFHRGYALSAGVPSRRCRIARRATTQALGHPHSNQSRRACSENLTRRCRPGRTGRRVATGLCRAVTGAPPWLALRIGATRPAMTSRPPPQPP